jgi:uncharacterized protein (UPF0333 family)
MKYIFDPSFIKNYEFLFIILLIIVIIIIGITIYLVIKEVNNGNK